MPYHYDTATDYLDLLDLLIDFATLNNLTAVVINAGGTGYAVDDILTVAGGTGTLTAQIRVTSVASGVIDGVRIEKAGAYSVNPTTTANAVTGGSGSGATMDLTMTTNGWVVNREQTYDTTENEVLFQGEGSGSDEIYVGIRTYRDVGNDLYNWELAGMTGYASGSDWDLQPGISPGRHDSGTPSDDGGAFMPLDDGSIDFWFNVDGRRMIIVAKMGTSYIQGYLGFYDSFATASELPYPIAICGATCQRNTRFNSTRAALSGLVDPVTKLIGSSVYCNGPLLVRFSDGIWYSIANAAEADNSGVATSTVSQLDDKVVSPPSHTDLNFSVSQPSDPEYGWLDSSSTWTWLKVKPVGGSTQTVQMRGIPNSPNDDVAIFPGTMMFSVTPSQQLLGQLNDVFWTSIAGSSMVDQDKITIGSDIYQIFHNGNKTEAYDFMAMKINY